jgi:hypothetical protein
LSWLQVPQQQLLQWQQQVTPDMLVLPQAGTSMAAHRAVHQTTRL